MLTRKVRLLTTEQAARTWWAATRQPARNASVAFARLAARGWLQMYTLSARPELRLKEPVFTWKPGEPAPRFWAIAYRLQRRWKEPLQRTVMAVATELAAKHFGGRGGPLTHPLQASHDLHVTALFLKLRAERPHAVSQWIPEHALARFRRHAKLPDAAIGRSPDHLIRVIEFGNGYDRDRVAAFHADCAERELPYQLW